MQQAPGVPVGREYPSESGIAGIPYIARHNGHVSRVD